MYIKLCLVLQQKSRLHIQWHSLFSNTFLGSECTVPWLNMSSLNSAQSDLLYVDTEYYSSHWGESLRFSLILHSRIQPTAAKLATWNTIGPFYPSL